MSSGDADPRLDEVRIDVPGLAPEIARRHELLRRDLEEIDADALLVTREGSVTYLTGYTTRTWSNFSRPLVAVLTASGALHVLCADTEVQQVEARVPGTLVHGYGGLREVERQAAMPDGRVQFVPAAVTALARLLADEGFQRLAVDGLAAVHPPISQLTSALSAGPETIDFSVCMWRRRLIKSAWEVEQLRAAARVLERAFELLPDRLEPDLTERELHGRLAAGCFEAGADELGYTDVVTVGGGREIFGAPTDKRWRADEVLYVDGGVVVNGYWADFCRQYTVGEPRAADREAFARVVAARDRALEDFRVGMTAGDLGRLIGEVTGVRAADHQAGRFGHGIGLYMPEPPSLAPVDTTQMEAGVAFCLEPMLMAHGTHFVLEEEYVVSRDGLEPITNPAPQGLIAI
jgi:Xaa-Pro aminopeptidase